MDERLKLENQLCFPLYAAAKEVVRRYRPLLDPLGLTYTQYITMMLMWQYRSMTISELGQRLYLDSGTLTPMLKKMEQSGWIVRTRCCDDERKVDISLTERGEALREQVAHVPQQAAQCLTMSSEEAQELYRLLYKLLTSLEQQTK